MSTSTLPMTFDSHFAELVARWKAHRELPRTTANIADLAASRQALDQARSEIRSLCIAA
jgi:hypothetical protein